MQNILPVILYNLDGSIIKNKKITSKSNNFYFYSYQNFNVEILDGEGELYSVIEKINSEGEKYLETSKNLSFLELNNFGYTLIFNENLTTINLKITSKSGFVDVYTINYILDNSETIKYDLYDDLIVNNYLPTLEELLPALKPNSVKSDILKRMLLDFKFIVSKKGNKECIDRFFSLIGYIDKQINVYSEYRKTNDILTLNPNKLTDVKTGNYHVIYDNWDSEELNECNLPYRPFSTTDFDALFETLKYAIPLANTYFTSKEQNIVFFGINFNSNNCKNKTIASTINSIYTNDVYNFRNYTNINLFYYDLSKYNDILKINLVKNKNQINNKIYLSEIKYILDSPKINNELFFVKSEFYDNSIINEELINYYTDFGNILNLQIDTKNKYVEIFINSINGNKLTFEKTFVENKLLVYITTCVVSEYKITVNIYDEYNNRESYIYDYVIDLEKQMVNYDIYTSHVLSTNNLINSLTSDVLSTNQNIYLPNNYILNIGETPENLSDYYKIKTNNKRWLNGFTNISNSLNTNNKIIDITETIPLQLIEQNLEYLFIDLPDSYDILTDFEIGEIHIKNCYNVDEVYKLTNNGFDSSYVKYQHNKIYLSVVEVEDRYNLFIVGDIGINLNEKSFNLFVYDENKTPISIYKSKTNSITLYQDINLNNGKIIHSDFENNTVESLFSKLMLDEAPNNNYLKLGDVIVCKLNDNYVTDAYNIIWYVFDAFTNRLLYTTENYVLNYTLDKKTIYNIRCEFVIDGQQMIIEKESILTTFDNL